ncbi:hypothetical protein EHO98_15315 [Leptospira stimsonii]|uniref:Alginate export domain-containing protein n=1 Tax=Leptospira stimsonii TaxID=2202203 RepID=A0ABY2NEX1_9LEPT|nr:hypothetical protein EHO98_15315 [Leptospira stimsonii]TGM22896.1 hypothetical protein EHQ90_00250 [Leptospira stimsonii]
MRTTFLRGKVRGGSAPRTGLSAPVNKFKNSKLEKSKVTINLLTPRRSLPQFRNEKTNWRRFGILLWIVLPITTINAESFPEYRLDDLLLLQEGKRDLKGKGRFSFPEKEFDIQKKENETLSETGKTVASKRKGTKEETESFGVDSNSGEIRGDDTRNDLRPDSSFYLRATMLYRGLTQDGGKREEQARRSFSRGIVSPEFGWVQKKTNFYQQILVSPFLQYEESLIGTKTVTRGADGELLYISGWETPSWKLGAEAGRGYQRLDRNGFLFVGFLNYGEFIAQWKPLGLSFSAIGAQIQDSILYSERNRNESPRRISGTSFSLSDHYRIQNIRIFYYIYQESRQDPVKGDLFLKENPLRPYGRYQYYGFEFSSAPKAGLSLDLDGIVVSGLREYGLNAFQSYRTSVSTFGSMFGTKLNWQRPEATYFIGGLYSSKDPNLRTDSDSNGYSGIRTDPRGYGGKTSFLLMESLLLQEGTVFREDGNASRPNFENKGLQLFQVGARKTWEKRWTAQAMILTSSSPMGRGWEGIGTAGFQSEHSYILMSLSYALVDPQKQEKILFDEWTKKADKKEYSRIYLSAGVYF